MSSFSPFVVATPLASASALAFTGATSAVFGLVALSAKLPNIRWTLRHHGRLLAALRAGDAGAARQAIEDDIGETLEELLKKANFEDGKQVRPDAFKR